MTTMAVTAQAAREELYETIRKEGPFEQKAREALALGKRYLGADNGHLTRIDQEADHWEAIASTDPPNGQFPEGLELDLGTTYCRRTVADGSQVVLRDAPNQGWADDPAFETHGLHCYHGTSLVVDGEPYGTVCFVAEDPHEQFSDGETMFAELIARLLERELERKQHEVRLARQTNLAVVLNRVLRHNLRNDLCVIRGYTQMIVDEPGGSRHGETVLAAVDGLIKLSEKARQLDRIVATSLDRERIEITDRVEEIVQTVSREYPSASFSVDYDENATATVLSNFEQALVELIENAAKHGGPAPTVRVGVEATSSAVEIRIADDGPGLADHEIDVLQAGSETPLTHGSGLGLWLSHWVVSSHDGSIDATVTEEGTTMTVSIPRNPTSDVDQQVVELQRARDQYRAAFEAANDAMIILDDEARIIDANPEASEIYGVEQQALLGQPFKRFLPDEFDFEGEWRAFKNTDRERDTVTIVGADGVERRVEYSAATDVVPGQHLVVSRELIGRDNGE